MKLTVGITGSRGLLGWHTSVYLKTLPGIELELADRKVFENPILLEVFARKCDVIFHCAGMNRGVDAEIAATNVSLTRALIAALNKTKTTKHVIFSSSTHIARESSYGKSKRECATLLEAWARISNALFTNLILPNIFGERGKPFYNSVVSTFCYQVSVGEAPKVFEDVQLEQIHAQSVARIFWDIVQTKQAGEVWVPGRKTSVVGLLDKIRDFHRNYISDIFPDVRDEFDRDLFNTYRSYLYPSHYPRALTLNSDARGSLFESVKTFNGGQTFLSTTLPGITRGNHFHTRKIERFLVVKGMAQICIRRVLSEEVNIFDVSGAKPSFVDIPTLHTHNITNIGNDELITLFWTHEFYDPLASDTTMEQV